MNSDPCRHILIPWGQSTETRSPSALAHALCPIALFREPTFRPLFGRLVLLSGGGGSGVVWSMSRLDTSREEGPARLGT